MHKIDPFTPDQLEAISRAIGNTTNGLSGSEIEYILADMRIRDVDGPGTTKWKRIFNALVDIQNETGLGNHTIMLVNRVMKPARFINDKGRFEWLQDQLNMVLSLCGYSVRDDGKVASAKLEKTLTGARSRARRLHTALIDRKVHAEVLKYCRAELVEKNYFHAVLEATKGIAQRIRDESGLTSDGAQLARDAFLGENPRLQINDLANESDESEQRGFGNLLIGLFGAVRNPTAHAPKISWPMPEDDALDILTFISYLHRKLDSI